MRKNVLSTMSSPKGPIKYFGAYQQRQSDTEHLNWHRSRRERSEINSKPQINQSMRSPRQRGKMAQDHISE